MRTVLIGGQESGRQVEATGQPEYRFPKQEETPLTTVEHLGSIVSFRTVRYIKTRIAFDNEIFTIYVWEHDIHRNPLELLISEFARLFDRGNT